MPVVIQTLKSSCKIYLHAKLHNMVKFRTATFLWVFCPSYYFILSKRGKVLHNDLTKKKKNSGFFMGWNKFQLLSLENFCG